MTTHDGIKQFEGATLTRASFKGTTLRFSDVTGMKMRGVDVDGLGPPPSFGPVAL